MLVLYERQRIVDANPAAQTFIGKSEDVVGSAAVEMLAGLAEMLEVGQGQINVVLSQSQRTCEVSLLPLDRDRTRRDGYLVMLQDISERKKPEAKEAADQKNRERIWAMDTLHTSKTVFFAPKHKNVVFFAPKHHLQQPHWEPTAPKAGTRPRKFRCIRGTVRIYW